MSYLELITNYQIILILTSILITALVIGGVFYYYTSDLKAGLISILSISLVPILTLIFLYITYEYFNVIPSEKHTLILWASLFFNITNLITLISKYAREILKKDFDIDYVTRYHFHSTLDLFVIILVTIGAISIFMYLEMLIILLLILIISSLVIWFNHLIARFLLQDK